MTININSYQLKATDGTHYILETYMEAIHGAMRFMKKVVYGKELFSTAYTTVYGKPKTTISSLGKHLKALHSYSRIFSKDYKFSPLLEFFLEEYRKHPIKDYFSPVQGHDLIGVDLFNDFVALMRKNAVVSRLKKVVSDWESKSKKNMNGLKDLETELFERHARVMAIRLDFNYHKATFTPEEVDGIIVEAAVQIERDHADYLAGQDISTPRTVEGRIALEEVRIDRERLFTNMKGKPSLFKHLVGYVWRIEFGRAAGYHLHLMLFFDGAYVKKHEYLAQEIGYYWQNFITNGRSYFENCNLKKEKYGDSWALGEIEHGDAAKRDNLINTLQYFCKTNQLVQVVPFAGCHLFGSRLVPQQRKVRSGRPRRKGVVGLNYQQP